MSRWLALLAFALLGCMPSADPRNADYSITHESLRPNVAYAIGVWQAAGSLDWREQPCTGEPRACVTFQWSELEPPAIGRTHRTSAYTHALVTIDPDLESWRVNEVTAHEVGHVLGMDHVMHDPMALMRPVAVGAWCIGNATRQEWALTWDAPLAEVCSGAHTTVGVVVADARASE